MVPSSSPSASNANQFHSADNNRSSKVASATSSTSCATAAQKSAAAAAAKTVAMPTTTANNNKGGANKSSLMSSKKRPSSASQRRFNPTSSPHLNKSTPSLNHTQSAANSPLSQRATIIGGVSSKSLSSPHRHVNRANVKDNGNSIVDTLLGDAAALSMAPKAKFRSDGEISICDNAKLESDHNHHQQQHLDHIYERIDSPKNGSPMRRNVAQHSSSNNSNNNGRPIRPPRATVAKNVVASKGRVLRRGGERDRSATVGEKKNGQQQQQLQQESRLSSEVQCWPWVPKCVNPSNVANVPNNKARSLPNAEIASSTSTHASRSRGRTPRGGVTSQRLERVVHVKEAGVCDDGKIGLVGKAARQQTDNTRLKSASLGCDNEKSSFFKNRSSSFTLLQQKLGGLRRSFSFRSSSSSQQKLPRSVKLIRQQEDQQRVKQLNNCDQDWVFFRGFGGKRREDLDLIEPYAVSHGPLLAIKPLAPQPQAPPRRKRPRRDAPQCDNNNIKEELTEERPLRRTLSLTDAHFIAQAVYEGDARLIEELYPDFPRSTPIYASIDKTKKERDRLRRANNNNGNSKRQQQQLDRRNHRQSHPSSQHNGNDGSSHHNQPQQLEDLLAVGKIRKATPPRLLTPIPGGGSSSSGEEIGVSGGENTLIPHSSSSSNTNANRPAAALDSSSSISTAAGLGSSSNRRGKLSPSAHSTTLDGDKTARVSATNAKEKNKRGVGGGGEVSAEEERRALLPIKQRGDDNCTPTTSLLPSSSSSSTPRSLPVDPATRGRADVRENKNVVLQSRLNHHHHRLLPASPLQQSNNNNSDNVTFSSPVMFVKQASDLHSRIMGESDCHVVIVKYHFQ